MTEPREVRAIHERFRIERELGRGGQAVVYRARDLVLQQTVALKVLNTVVGQSGELFERFRREAATAARLDHPNICRILASGVTDGQPWIAMQFIDGRSLGARIREKPSIGASALPSTLFVGDGSLAPEREEPATVASPAVPSRSEITTIVEILEKAARALHAAHEAGVIHRDVKPANIMVDRSDEPFVLDFGMAKDDADQTLTATGDLFGTPAYMSPEQLLAQRVPLDRRTDVWSLGVALYEAVTLRRPFDAPTRQGLFAAVLGKDPPDPRTWNRAVTADLRAIIETALEKDRDRRYQTAKHLADDLARLRRNESTLARPITFARRTLRWSRRHPARAALIAAIVLAIPTVAGLSGYIFANRDKVEAARVDAFRRDVDQRVEAAFAALMSLTPSIANAGLADVLSRDPGNVEAEFGVVWSALHLGGDPQRALADLDAWRADHPSPIPPALLQLRRDLLNRLDRRDDAEKLGATIPKPATKLDWHLEGIRLLAGERALAPAMPPTARDALDAFAQCAFLSESLRPVTLFGMACAAREAQDRAACLRTADTLEHRWPDSPEALTWAAFALTQCESARALSLLERARSRGTNAARAGAIAGDAYLALGRSEDAAAALRRSLAAQSDGARAVITLVRILHDAGRAAEALATLDAFSARRSVPTPLAAAADHLRGQALQQLGRRDDAILACEAALERDPRSASAWLTLGRLLIDAERIDAGAAACERAVALRPDDFDVDVNAARVLAEVGQTDSAIACLRRAVALRPDSAEALCRLGHVLQETGPLDESLALIERGHALAASQPGWSLPSRAWLDDARRSIDVRDRVRMATSGTNPPQSTTEQLEFGRVAARTNRPDLAIGYFRRAIEEDPNLVESPKSTVRFMAARAAVDAAALASDDSARRGLLDEALPWLQLELRLLLDRMRAAENARDAVQLELRRWLVLRQLAPVRDGGMPVVPIEARSAWTAFWSQVRTACGPHAPKSDAAAESRP